MEEERNAYTCLDTHTQPGRNLRQEDADGKGGYAYGQGSAYIN